MRVLFLSLLFMTFLVAEQTQEERIKRLERRMDRTDRDTYPISGSKVTKGLPSAKGCPYDSGFFIGIEYLYWRSHNSGYVYAFNNDRPTGPQGNFTRAGKVIRIDPEWTSGFRTILGYNTSYDEWDAYLGWTFYRNRITDRKRTTAGNDLTEVGLIPTWLTGDTFELNIAKARWLLNFNMLEFMMGRSFFVSDALSLRPKTGIGGGWVHQRFSAFYPRESQDPSADLPGVVRTYNKYWGVGPKVGVLANWSLTKGVSFFWDIMAAYLYGKFDVLAKVAQFSSQGINYQDDKLKWKDNFWELSPMVQCQLGLSFAFCFDKDSKYLQLAAGWEVQYWWNQYQLPSIITDNAPGAPYPNMPLSTIVNRPLVMIGLTARAQLDF